MGPLKPKAVGSNKNKAWRVTENCQNRTPTRMSALATLGYFNKKGFPPPGRRGRDKKRPWKKFKNGGALRLGSPPQIGFGTATHLTKRGDILGEGEGV